jgi:integrase
MREDYAPFFAFAHASGLRLRECLLRWPEVDFRTRQIRRSGKGDRTVTVPITSTIRKILWPLRGHHPEAVFTYQSQRTRAGRVKGDVIPSPITASRSRGVGCVSAPGRAGSASMTSGTILPRSFCARPATSNWYNAR